MCMRKIEMENCDIVVRVFERQSRYYLNFRTNTLEKDLKPIIIPGMGLIVLLLFFSNDGFGTE